MNDLVRDTNGKICNAKIMYNIGNLVALALVVFKVITTDSPDYSGLALLYAGIVGPLGAVYYGRNKTKAEH